MKLNIENLKASKVTNLLAAAAMAVPLIKSGKYTKVLEKNVQLVTDELIKANLQKRETQRKTQNNPESHPNPDIVRALSQDVHLAPLLLRIQ